MPSAGKSKEGCATQFQQQHLQTLVLCRRVVFCIQAHLDTIFVVCHKNFTPGFKVSRQLNISYSSPSSCTVATYLSKSKSANIAKFLPPFFLLLFQSQFQQRKSRVELTNRSLPKSCTLLHDSFHDSCIPLKTPSLLFSNFMSHLVLSSSSAKLVVILLPPLDYWLMVTTFTTGIRENGMMTNHASVPLPCTTAPWILFQ